MGALLGRGLPFVAVPCKQLDLKLVLDMSPIKLTLVREKANQRRILYAEVGKDFVDLLLSSMLLPIGNFVATTRNVAGLEGFAPGVQNIIFNVGALGERHLSVPRECLMRPTISHELKECVSPHAEELLEMRLSSHRTDCHKCNGKSDVTASGGHKSEDSEENHTYILTQELCIIPCVDSLDLHRRVLTRLLGNQVPVRGFYSQTIAYQVLEEKDLEKKDVVVGSDVVKELLATAFDYGSNILSTSL